MSDRKFRNSIWQVNTNSSGQVGSWAEVQACLLMDIREELQTLNRLLHCTNFTAIPHKLDRIERNTRKRRKKRKASQ